MVPFLFLKITRKIAFTIYKIFKFMKQITWQNIFVGLHKNISLI